MTQRDDDIALVRKALERVQDIKSARKAAKELGIAPKTLQGWRKGEMPDMREPLRNKLITKLESGAGGREGGGKEGVAPRAGGAPPYPYDLAQERADLARASSIADPVLRMMERENIMAVIRTQAVREAAWAARLAEENTAARHAERVASRKAAPVIPVAAPKERNKGAA